MAQDRRMLRRIAGLLKARLPDAHLDEVADPRQPRGKRWKRLDVLLRTTIVAMIAGCRSTAQTEALTAELSLPMRKLLRIGRRLPDTTLRSTLMAVQPDELRRCLYAQVRAAHRRKRFRRSRCPSDSLPSMARPPPSKLGTTPMDSVSPIAVDQAHMASCAP